MLRLCLAGSATEYAHAYVEQTVQATEMPTHRLSSACVRSMPLRSRDAASTKHSEAWLASARLFHQLLRRIASSARVCDQGRDPLVSMRLAGAGLVAPFGCSAGSTAVTPV